MRRLITMLLATVLTALLLATPVSAAPPPLPGMEEMMAQMEQDTAELPGLTGKDFAVAYMQKMRGHHLAAIEMAELVPTRATLSWLQIRPPLLWGALVGMVETAQHRHAGPPSAAAARRAVTARPCRPS